MTKMVTKKMDVADRTSAETEANESSLPIWKDQFGRVQGAMWRHPQNDGKRRFTISVSRSYKDKETDKWMSVHYFDSKDLRDIRAICDAADEAILKAKGMVQVVGED